MGLLRAGADRGPSLPQVNDFLSGRSPLTLALRVGDHMMFVQLQLAAQQSSGQLQHRHVITSRGEAGATASPHCRTLHGSAGSGFARIPVVPACQQNPAPSPAPSAPAPPMYCNAPHPAPVTAGMFRSHGASTQTVNSSVVSSCSEVSRAWGQGEQSCAIPSPAAAMPFPASVSPRVERGCFPACFAKCPQVPRRGSGTGCNPGSCCARLQTLPVSTAGQELPASPLCCCFPFSLVQHGWPGVGGGDCQDPQGWGHQCRGVGQP